MIMENQTISHDEPSEPVFAYDNETSSGIVSITTSTSTASGERHIFLTISNVFLLFVALPTFLRAFYIVINRSRKRQRQQQQQQQHSLTNNDDVGVVEEGNIIIENNNENNAKERSRWITIERVTLCITSLSIIFALVQSIIVHSSCNIIHVDDDSNDYSIGFWSYDWSHNTCSEYGENIYFDNNNSPYTIRLDPSIQYAAILDIISTVVAFLFILRCILIYVARENAVVDATKGLIFSLLMAAFFHINSLISISSSGLCRDDNSSVNNNNDYICGYSDIGFIYAILTIIYWLFGAVGVFIYLEML